MALIPPSKCCGNREMVDGEGSEQARLERVRTMHEERQPVLSRKPRAFQSLRLQVHLLPCPHLPLCCEENLILKAH